MKRILDLAYKEYPRMYLIIKFTVSTGLRRSEILGLRWKHIDENYIHVEEQYQKNELGEFDKVSLKSEKSERMIPLNEVTREVLEEQNKLQEEGKKKLGGLKDEGYVFLDELGEKFKHGYLSKKFKEIVDGLEIDGTFHTLRHTFASILIKNGCDIQAVSELLGHYDTAFTLRTYVHLFKNVKEKAIVTLDKESWLRK